MPRPVYIVVADKVIEDKGTNLVTIVSVLEKLTVHIQKVSTDAIPKGQKPPDISSLSLDWSTVAVWMREKDDTGRFEHQWVVVTPDGTEVNVAKPAEFAWADATKRLHRFRMMSKGVPPAKSSGIILVESRIRPLGGNTWLSQRFPVEIELTGDAEEVLAKVAFGVDELPTPRTADS